MRIPLGERLPMSAPTRPSVPSWTRPLAGNRAVDLAGSLAGLWLLLPALATIAVLIRWDSPGPVLFRRLRRGYRGRLFRTLMFRTMVADAEQELGGREQDIPPSDSVLHQRSDDSRVTRVGSFLRAPRPR